MSIAWVASPNFSLCQGSCATNIPSKPQRSRRNFIGRGRSGSPEKKTYTVPAGTNVLLQIRRPQHQERKPGDGVYLIDVSVVVGSRVMIPAGVLCQGVVDRVARAGRVKRRAHWIFIYLIIFQTVWCGDSGIVTAAGARAQRKRR